MPSELVAFACGSRSTSRTRTPSARYAPRLTAVVVLPTPPFWLATATTGIYKFGRQAALRHKSQAAELRSTDWPRGAVTARRLFGCPSREVRPTSRFSEQVAVGRTSSNSLRLGPVSRQRFSAEALGRPDASSDARSASPALFDVGQLRHAGHAAFFDDERGDAVGPVGGGLPVA